VAYSSPGLLGYLLRPGDAKAILGADQRLLFIYAVVQFCSLRTETPGYHLAHQRGLLG
jgi:hypothetical protein